MIEQSQIKVIAFDADDTLWVNEPYFKESEKQFFELMRPYITDEDSLSEELLKIEIANLPDYGFGVKAFMLSMIETAIKISKGRVPASTIQQIMNIGRKQLHAPVELLPDIETVLKSLQPNYRVIVATKGDLLDQERKLEQSGLSKYFHHIEIMSDKKIANYQKLIHHLDIDPTEFLMIGNSIKSDILPVIELGGSAIRIPFHTSWAYEEVEEVPECSNFYNCQKIKDLLCLNE